MIVLYWMLGVVALQRLIELAHARRNSAWLRRRGGEEADAAGYRFFVVLHAGWLVSLAASVPPATPPYWPLIGVFALLQLGRVWVILSLGRFWTTRIITLPDAPLVRSGPFRYLRHPNYLIVVAEIAIFPMAFGAVAIAAIFSVLNLVLVVRRIQIEERALAPRRAA